MTGGAREAGVAAIVDGDRFMLTYGDGVADVDIARARPRSTSGHGTLGTVTGVRPPLALRRAACVRRPRARSSARSRRPHEGWINGGFFVFERERPRLPRRRRRMRARARAARAAGAGRAARRLSRTTASGSAWTRIATTSCSTSCGSPGRRRGSGGEARRRDGRAGCVLARPARPSSPAAPAWSGAGSSDGCSGLGAMSSAWCATGCRRASCSRAACSTGSRSCAATSCDQPLARTRARASTRSTRSSTSRRRRSSASPTATRSRRSRRNIRGTWALLEACRRSPDGEADRRRLVRQGLRRLRHAALRRERRRCEGGIPTTSSKSCAT